MSTIAEDIIELLGDDMVSHGQLAQCAQWRTNRDAPANMPVEGILSELLESGMVEIGNARLASPDYVEFVAWQGSVNERVKRALQSIVATRGPDQEFAYWLCLSQKVDRFEGVGSKNSADG